MILLESQWYRDVIRRCVQHESLVLNIGSSTKYVVEVSQPYIKKNVLDELVAKRCVVKNIDLKKSDGVDIIGDVSDPEFATKLRAMKPDVIICANTLEHIENRHEFCVGLESIVCDHTTLIVSVPHTFPYHEDPIDTMYRTDIAGLLREFPSLRLLEGKVLTMWYFSVVANRYHLTGKIALFIKGLIKLMINADSNVQWLFRRVHETCTVFVRKSPL